MISTTKSLRSEGILSRDAQVYARNHGVPLAFDPLQSGWVHDDVVDDLASVNARSATRALSFRPWADADVATYRALLDDRDLWRFMPEDYPDPVTEEMARQLITLSNDSNHHEVFAVCLGKTPIGQMRLQFGVDPTDDGVAEISYWLGQPFWGKGMGRVLVAQATRNVLARHPFMNAIVARVHRDNPASSKALLRAGYSKAGQDAAQPEWQIYRLDRPAR